jgi:hypothetical protein
VAGCWANTGSDSAIMVAATAILTQLIPISRGNFSDVLAQDRMGADSRRWTAAPARHMLARFKD